LSLKNLCPRNGIAKVANKIVFANFFIAISFRLYSMAFSMKIAWAYLPNKPDFLLQFLTGIFHNH